MAIKKHTLIRLGIGFILLLMGAGIYIVYNPYADFLNYIDIKLSYLTSSSKTWIDLLISSFLADYLWAMSFTVFIQSIVNLRRKQIYLLLLCPLLGIVFEIMQFHNWAKGTSDILDVVVYYLGSLTVIIIEIFFQGGKKNEES